MTAARPGDAFRPGLDETVIAGRYTDCRSPGSATVDDLQLDLQVCFAVHATARAFDRVYRLLLAGLGLTYPQYLVMLVLWEHGDLPVKSLGELLSLDSGTLSPLLKRMEGAGLVRRERSPRDERSVIISLTAESRSPRTAAEEVPRQIAVAGGLTAAKGAELR